MYLWTSKQSFSYCTLYTYCSLSSEGMNEEKRSQTVTW